MSAFRNAPRGSVIHRCAMLVVFAAVACAYAARWGFFGWHLAGPPPWVWPVAASVGGVVFFLAPMLFGRGAIAGGPEAEGERPLVLYLRPFQVDLANGVQLLLGALAGVFVWLGTLHVVFWPVALLPLFLNVTAEQRLHDALVSFGRLVAFGDPRARLHPVGAWRHHAGADWPAEMQRYLAAAALVIVRPGTSRSIAWEVDQVLDTVPIERLLFDLRFRGGRRNRQRAYDDFRARVRASRLAVELPERVGEGRYLVFDTARTPRFFTEPNHPEQLFRHFLWGDFNRDRLAPVLQVLGIDLPPAPSDAASRGSQRLLRVSVYIFAALLLVLLVMMAVLTAAYLTQALAKA